MLLFIILLFCVCVTNNASKPHIVFILSDDQGFHDVGYHGSEIKTPVIDELAQQGIKLENYYVQPICTPTRSQLMSGRYQIHTGMQHGVIKPSQPRGLPLDTTTLADKLKETGYRTHIVGKWHLGFFKKEYLPHYRGFDSFYGFHLGAEDYFTHKRCFDAVCGKDFWLNDTPLDKTVNHKYSTHLLAKRSVEIIKSHNPKDPLFLYLPFQAVHGPNEVPPKYKRPYKHLKSRKRQVYAGMVAAMDEAIGDVVNALKTTGLYNNTVIIFSSDNGGAPGTSANNWPLRGQKGQLWEGGIRVPCFVHGNILSRKGMICKELIHVSDWFPTLVNLAGGNLNKNKSLDGFDQWKTISEGKKSSRQEILHNIDPMSRPVGRRLKSSPFDNRIMAALRQGDWKLLTGNPGKGQWQKRSIIKFDAEDFEDHGSINLSSFEWQQNIWLFNITADPHEKYDVSQNHPGVIRRMLARLAYYNSSSVPPIYPDADPNSNPKFHGGYWAPWM